jgi:hypothetical protein
MFPNDEALNCEALDIQPGDLASMIYAGPDRTDDEGERQRILGTLLEYCKPDTLAMVMIWRVLGVITEMS